VLSNQSDAGEWQILLGGFFTFLCRMAALEFPATLIARLEKDGEVEQTLDPNVVGTNVSLPPFNLTAKFSSVVSLVTSWGDAQQHRALECRRDARYCLSPNANAAVFSIALQPDGKILVGGIFNGANSIGGQGTESHRRLNATTVRADSFDPNSNGSVVAIAVEANGKILVGGSFARGKQHRRQSRNHIARLTRRPAWPIHSTPTRTKCPVNRGAARRQDTCGRSLQRCEQHRRADSQPHRSTRSYDSAWQTLRPECEWRG